MKGVDVKVVVKDIGVTLGEGACWCPLTKKLLWVDIYSGRIFRYDPVNNENEEIQTFQPIGTVVPHTKDTVVAALLKGICVVNLNTKRIIERIASPEVDNIHTRWNDGKVCPVDGRFWVGSMGIFKGDGEGSLYSIDGERNVQKQLSELTISNGICWSPDGTTMYHIDTPTKSVTAFDYDVEFGTISNSRACIKIPDGMGYPDGCTIDSDGKIWIAMFGGSAVVRFDPESGALIDKIKLPVEQVTSVAFGGENLDKLFITTAAEGFTKKQKKQQPKAGFLFCADMSKVGITGLPSGVYAQTQ